METLKVPVDAKTKQNLQDVDRAINELQTRKILILQTICNVHEMKNPVVIGQYDCLQEKEAFDNEQKEKTEGQMLKQEA